ncbi:MAG: hypothetical protein II821_01335, partial [Treponema sp.]|nr:hypothetical protein [Treponema sp.]
MKKITLFILTIFTVATLFAAARPSLDGRAVVAESGTMPKGLFARTVGYLPGDSVTVTNPATGSTIDVLILGAIDPSEGVAILLSPEAAEGLRIKPESNVQVKLTKRAGSLDENANGSAVLSESTSNETSAPEKNETASEPETAETESAPETEVTPKTEEIPAVAENTLSESEAPVVAVEEEPEPVAPLPEKKDEVIEETPVVAENTEPYEEIPVVREPEKKTVPEYEEIPVVAETKPAQKVTGTVYEELPPLPEDEVEKVVVIETEKEEPEKATAELPAPTEEIVSAESEIPTEEAVPVTDAEKLQPVILVETEKVTSEEEDLQPVIE